MKFLTSFLIFYILIVSSSGLTIPRCEKLYNDIYKTEKYDVNKYTYENKKTIGIRLNKIFDEDLNSWVLDTNKDGYYKVGKITDSSLLDQIEIEDVIISINNIDLRKINKKDDDYLILEDDVSDLFEEGEKLEFKILKNEKEIIINKNDYGTELVTYSQTFSAPYIDFFVKSIEIDEKKGEFDASIETNYTEFLDDRYHISELVWDNIVYDKEIDDEGYYSYFWWEQCDFNDERWGRLNTEDPAYGKKFKNLVKEDRQVRKSSYNLLPTYEWVEFEPDYKIKDTGAALTYNSSSMYTFKNDFNLKTFPFDKQQLSIHLYNSKQDSEDERAIISSDSMKDALYFQDNNQIEGWNIESVDLKYKHIYDFKNETFHDGVVLEINIERKTGYYIFKIILPIFLILAVCWSAIWIDPIQIESRLTITIVCLLSLIAYNFVIDSELPKLEYLTIMDYIILVSYFYATIPNFISIIRFNLIKQNLDYEKYQNTERLIGLPSYILIILFIIYYNLINNVDNASGYFLGVFS